MFLAAILWTENKKSFFLIKWWINFSWNHFMNEIYKSLDSKKDNFRLNLFVLTWCRNFLSFDKKSPGKWSKTWSSCKPRGRKFFHIDFWAANSQNIFQRDVEHLTFLTWNLLGNVYERCICFVYFILAQKSNYHVCNWVHFTFSIQPNNAK